MKYRIAAILFAMAGLVGIGAVPAQAASGLCWVGGVQTARLYVSKWQGSNGVWQVHIDMNAGGKYTPYRFYIDGVAKSSWNDAYYGITPGTHTYKGRWLYPVMEEQASIYCSVTL